MAMGGHDLLDHLDGLSRRPDRNDGDFSGGWGLGCTGESSQKFCGGGVESKEVEEKKATAASTLAAGRGRLQALC